MNISAIYLENFKTFNGKHRIEGLDATLSEEKNIILIGGLNGAGKTTLLEAITLCFYGNRATHLYPTRGAKNENYNAYIISLLNNNVKNQNPIWRKNLSVEVFLSNVRLVGDVGRNISLKRYWEIDITKNKIEEVFEISENGKRMEGVEQGEYEKVIDNILPYNVSQFFFFDGEKIQDFAADPEVEFARSLKDILGISLYGQLYDDIKQVRSRIINVNNKNGNLGQKKKEKELELEKEIGKAEDYKIKIEQLEEEIEKLNKDKEEFEYETRRLTGITAKNREEFIKRKAELEKEQELLEVEFVKRSREYLPFMLARNLCEELDMQIRKEEEYMHRQVVKKSTEEKVIRIVERIFDDEPPPPQPLLTEQKSFYREKAKDVLLGEFVKVEKDNDITVIHHLSTNDYQKIRSELNKIKNEIISPLKKTMQRLKEIEIEIEKIRKSEGYSGNNQPDILELFDKIKNISERIGAKKQEIKELEHEIDESQRRQSELKSDITNLEREVDIQRKHKIEIEYCGVLCNAIEEFQNRYQASKVEHLKKSVLEMWTKLARKEDQVAGIEIIPDRNFEIKLYDAKKHEIDKTKLSAGEKEIYAISLLWALVQASGRQIPVIIDTPYGRLDSIHRMAIAKEYFPNASHQVFLLSQDEEIVGEYYDAIKPRIAKELTITFDESAGCSKFEDGYAFVKSQS